MSVYFNDLDHAIFFTLCYSDYFKFPLTKTEIFNRLPKVWDWLFLTGQKLKTNKLLINNSKNNFDKSMLKLEKAQIIFKIQEQDVIYYYLKNRQQLIIKRKNLEKIAKKRQTVINDASNWLKIIPSIKAVALTGSSALKNAVFYDDLDFCVITSKNALWITRFFVILLAKVLAKQPQIDAQANINNRQAWCFNLWLDESGLNIVNRGLSIYQAYELMQMDWLFDKDHLKIKMLRNNIQFAELINLKIKNDFVLKMNKSIIYYLLWPINYLFYFLQSIYRYVLFGRENYLLSPNQAHFNDLKRQLHIFKKVKRTMQVHDFSDF